MLALTEVSEITGVKIMGSNNNEPSHGGGLADTSGAIMKSSLWKWTHKNSRDIQQARLYPHLCVQRTLTIFVCVCACMCTVCVFECE